MSYTASYRKFRPQTFEDVKGQDAIVKTLKNQIITDRIGHAYLFCGTRGTGKTSVAKILARAVNCEHPVDGNPCGECEVCKKIAAGTIMNVVEIDAASNNSVDDVRRITEEVAYSPTEGKYKVYIVDEVHMLSTSAFNALLKTLEEPPAYVIFILATTESHKILPTILSRCQRYDFKRISVDEIVSKMTEMISKEGIQAEENALRYIAKAADGAMRDAWSLLDRCIAFHYGEVLTYDDVIDVLGVADTDIFEELISAIIADDVLKSIAVVDRVVAAGKDLTQFVIDFTWYLRNLMLVKSASPTADTLEVSNETLNKLKAAAEKIELNSVMRYIRIFSELSGQMKYSTQKRILLEVAVVKLCKPQMEVGNDSVLERIRSLERKIENGVAVSYVPGGTVPEAVKAPEPPKMPAVTEEIKKIVQNRAAITDGLPQPLKTYVANCKMSGEKDNELILVSTSKVEFDSMKTDERRARIKQEFEDYIGKEIALDIRFLDENEYFEDHFPDFDKAFGGMEIEITED